MDSLKFKVEQVNFEENDLADSSISELDSFDSLYNCNYSFDKQPDVPSAQESFSLSPLTSESTLTRKKAKNITRTIKSISSPVTSIRSNTESPAEKKEVESVTGPGESDPINSTPVTTIQKVSSNCAAVRQYLNTSSGKTTRILVHRRASRMDDTEASLEGDNASFETVAEALHLQWSVIGDANVAPASPEAIAQAIAEAQKKMTPIKSDDKISAAGDMFPETIAPFSPIVGFSGDILTADISPTISAALNVSSTTSTIDLITTTSSNQRPKVSSVVVKSDDHNIVSSTPVKNTHIDDTRTGAVRSLDLSARSPSASIKSEEQLSESGSVDYILDTEAFLNSLPPIRPLDIAAFVSSAKEKVSHARKLNDVNFDTVEKRDENMQGKIDVIKNDDDVVELRPLDRLVDELLAERGKMGVGKVKMPINIEPLFNKRSKVPSVSSSGILTGSIESRSHDNVDMDLLMKEKAKLEGQVEMLVAESDNVMRERAELQTQVAALRQQIKQDSQKVNSSERDKLIGEVGSLKKKCFHIEQAMIDMQKILEEKDSEAKNLGEELQLSQELSDGVQKKFRMLHDEMQSKEMTIQGLKNKIAELYVDVQNVMQAKMQSDNEMMSAKNDVSMLVSTKEWYQQQLHTAHAERSELQKQLSKVIAQEMTQTTIVDKLKVDNAVLRQDLTRLQQQALTEKEALARHLEKIEADMLDRESKYREVQRERTLMEDTLNTRLDSVGEDSMRMSQMSNMTSDLEAQLAKSQNDAKRMASQIEKLEAKQIESLKEFSVAQTTTAEKDRIVQELEYKLIEVDSELKVLRNDIMAKDNVILRLNEDKASAEIALSSALQDKKSVDDALESFRSDMNKVDRTFRQMKQELSARSEELENVKKDKAELNEQLEDTLKKLKQLEILKETSNTEISDKDLVIVGLKMDKDNLITELEVMKTESDKKSDKLVEFFCIYRTT